MGLGVTKHIHMSLISINMQFVICTLGYKRIVCRHKFWRWYHTLLKLACVANLVQDWPSHWSRRIQDFWGAIHCVSFYFPTLAPYIATGLGIATSCCILCCEYNQLVYFISLSGFYPASAHHCNSFHAESQCCAHPQLAGFSRWQGDISSQWICDMHTGL